MSEPSGRRVLVTGLPASGKTTLAAQLARRDGVPHVEVDSLYYGPAFVPRPTFREDLERALEGPAWYADDVGHPEAIELTWGRADTLVWLDLPYGIAASRAIRRTWRRLRDRDEVLPGCRESWIGWGHPKHPVRLTVTRHGHLRRVIEHRLADPRYSHLAVVRLRTRDEVAAYTAADRVSG
jgi:adenylate kinase family enzyme